MSKIITDNKKDNMPKSSTTTPIETTRHTALKMHNHEPVFSDVDDIKIDTRNDCQPSGSRHFMSKSTRVTKETGTYTDLIACNGRAETHHRPYHTIC